MRCRSIDITRATLCSRLAASAAVGGGRCSAVDCSFVGAGRYCSPRFPGNCRFGASRWCGAGAAPYTAATSAGVRSWGADLAVPDDEGPAAQPAAAASAAAVVGGFNRSATRWPAGNVDVSGGGERLLPCTGADAGRPSFGGDELAGRVAFIALPGMDIRGGGARSRRLVEPSRPLRGRSRRRAGMLPTGRKDPNACGRPLEFRRYMNWTRDRICAQRSHGGLPRDTLMFTSGVASPTSRAIECRRQKARRHLLPS